MGTAAQWLGILALVLALSGGAWKVFGQAGTSSPANFTTVNLPMVMLGSGFGDKLTYSVTGCEANFGITTVNTGSATTTTGQNCALAGAIIDAVVIRTITTITTATSFSVGVSGSTAQFCATLTANITAGQTTVCTAQYNSSGIPLNRAGLAPILVTFAGGTPGAGAMRIIVYSHQATAPTS